MGVITAAVEQGQALPWDFICKILLTALTLSAGFKGGRGRPQLLHRCDLRLCIRPAAGPARRVLRRRGPCLGVLRATNTLIPSILLAYELFGGVGLELIALAAASVICSPAPTASTAASSL